MNIPANLLLHWQRGIEFIALNDEPLDLNVESIRGYISVIVMSETFQVDVEKVANAVLRKRKKT